MDNVMGQKNINRYRFKVPAPCVTEAEIKVKNEM